MSASQPSDAILIIDDGAPGALAACLLCEAPESSVLWVPANLRPARGRRVEAVRRHAEMLGFPPPVEAPGETPPGRLARPRMLLEAAAEAAGRGFRRVIWAEHLGENLDAMSAAADQASLISHICLLDGGGDDETAPVRVETPFLDLTLGQIIELARDLDLPADACWWCEGEAATPCGECVECRRWRPLVRTEEAWAATEAAALGGGRA